MIKSLVEILALYGGVNLAVNRVLFGVKFSVATYFWLSWLLLLLAVGYLVSLGLPLFIKPELYKILYDFFRSAFVAFISASFVLFLKTNLFGSVSFSGGGVRVINIIDKWLKPLLIILALTGTVYFAQRLSSVGISAGYLSSARAAYLVKNFNLFEWVGNHISVAISTLIIMMGIRDAELGHPKLNVVAGIVVVSAPLYLANASRTFLLFPFLNYFISYTSVNFYVRKKILPENVKFRTIFFYPLLFVFVFAVLGWLRGGYGENLDIILTILSWPASTLFVMDDWVYVASQYGNLSGLIGFDWFIEKFEIFRIVDYSKERSQYNFALKWLESHGSSALVVPKSIVVELIFDWGVTNFPYIVFITFFVAEYMFSTFIKKGGIRRFIAVNLAIGSFMTIQLGFLNPGSIMGFLWGVIYYTKCRTK